MADPKNKWSQPAAPPPPMFFGKKERELVKQVNDELAERIVGQAVAYYPISLEESNFNKTYGEAVEKVALPPIRVYAYVVVENEQTNEKYGYEYTNKLTVNFHRSRLTADQDLYVRVGDYVQYGEKFYEIVKTYNDTRYLFGQVEHKFQISAECVEARPGAFRVEKELTRPAAVSGSSGDTSAPAPRAAPYPPLDATYITVTADPKLPNERVLTAGAGITLTDSGPGSAMTIAATAGGDGIFTAVNGSAAYTTSSATFGAATTPTHTLTVAGTTSGSGVATFGSSISSSGDVAVTGAVHAAQFYGGGAGITGISADGVDVTSSTTDINYPMVFTEGFQTDGSLGLAGNTAFIYNPSDNVISSSAALQAVGNSIFGGTLNISGNVGIGTDAPSAGATLEVAGTTAVPNPAVRITGTGPKLQFDENDAGAGKFQIAASNGMLKWQVQNAAFDAASVKWMMNSDGQMAFRDGAAGEAIPARIYISGSGNSNLLQLSSSTVADILVVTGSGRVGIGTASPSHTLTVAGTLSGSGVVRLATSLSSSGDVAVTGNVHATQFYGGGGNLTGISADAIDVTSSTGDINYPVVFTEGFQTDGTLGLGGNTGLVYNPNDAVLSSSAAIQAVGATILGNTLHVSGAVSGAVGITGSSGIFDVQVSSSALFADTAVFSNNVTIAGLLVGTSPVKISGALDIVDSLGNVISGLGTSTFSSSAGAMFGQAVSASSDLAVSGNLHATTYYGDGSNLTGIDSASGSARQYSSTGMETSGYLKVSGSAIFGAGITHKRSAITAATYTILVTDYYIGADTSSNTITLTLPAASAAGSGKTYVIKDEGGNAAANAITVDGNGSETVDGAATVDVTSPYGALNLYSDGSNWFVY
jgi:hypothetical protein